MAASQPVPRLGLGEFQSDDQIADVGARRARVNEITGGLEGRRRIGAAQAVIDIETGTGDAGAGIAIHQRTGIRRGTVGAVGADGQQQEVFLPGDEPSHGQRAVLIAATTTGMLWQLHHGFASPGSKRCFAQVQLVRAAHREASGVLRKAPR